jgi:hypothetical protein
LGVFLPMMNLVGQNAHPPRIIGVSTSTINYLRSLGQTLGLAIVGTVVTHTIDTELSSHLPGAAKQLPPQALQYATNIQSLVNPTYRDTVVSTGKRYAAAAVQKQAIANAHVPPGPQHDQIVATIGQQAANHAAQSTQTLLDQVFEALRQVFALGVTRGFVAVWVFCGIAFVAVLFLKDIPLARRAQEKPTRTKEEESKILNIEKV